MKNLAIGIGLAAVSGVGSTVLIANAPGARGAKESSRNYAMMTVGTLATVAGVNGAVGQAFGAKGGTLAVCYGLAAGLGVGLLVGTGMSVFNEVKQGAAAVKGA
jgi:hypothetical protein